MLNRVKGQSPGKTKLLNKGLLCRDSKGYTASASLSNQQYATRYYGIKGSSCLLLPLGSSCSGRISMHLLCRHATRFLCVSLCFGQAYSYVHMLSRALTLLEMTNAVIARVPKSMIQRRMYTHQAADCLIFRYKLLTCCRQTCPC